MRYYSEEQIRDQFDPFECEGFFKRQNPYAINVRLCRECEFFEPEHPAIADIGFCKLHTEFDTEDNVPNWWFCDKNDFCNEDWI